MCRITNRVVIALFIGVDKEVSVSEQGYPVILKAKIDRVGAVYLGFKNSTTGFLRSFIILTLLIGA